MHITTYVAQNFDTEFALLVFRARGSQKALPSLSTSISAKVQIALGPPVVLVMSFHNRWYLWPSPSGGVRRVESSCKRELVERERERERDVRPTAVDTGIKALTRVDSPRYVLLKHYLLRAYHVLEDVKPITKTHVSTTHLFRTGVFEKFSIAAQNS